MRLYETSFMVDYGLKAAAKIYGPGDGHSGFATLALMAPDERSWNAPLSIRLPYSMGSKAERIAAAINSIMQESDEIEADTGALVEAFAAE